MNNLKERGVVVGLTILLFLSGLFTGIWIQRLQPPPPPPLPLHEFGAQEEHRDRTGWSAERAKEMSARMEQMRPQMEEFRRKLTTLQEDYRTKIELLLTIDQKKKLDEMTSPDGGAGHPEKPHDAASPSDAVHSHRDNYMMGMAKFIGMVVYKPQVEMLTKELVLTNQQQEEISKLLQQRREDLLALVDTTPPPSLHPMGADWKHP